jgi:hypothetical protein
MCNKHWNIGMYIWRNLSADETEGLWLPTVACSCMYASSLTVVFRSPALHSRDRTLRFLPGDRLPWLHFVCSVSTPALQTLKQVTVTVFQNRDEQAATLLNYIWEMPSRNMDCSVGFHVFSRFSSALWANFGLVYSIRPLLCTHS